MTPFVLLTLGLLVAFFAVGGLRRLNPPQRRRALRWMLFASLVLGMLLLVRFRLHWVGVVGAGAWVLLKTLGPLILRLLPFLARLRAERMKRTPGPAPKTADAETENASGPQAIRMTREEALEILGAKPNASSEEILASYKSLIRKVHPDSPGGSNYLAAKLNQAKEVLLG